LQRPKNLGTWDLIMITDEKPRAAQTAQGIMSLVLGKLVVVHNWRNCFEWMFGFQPTALKDFRIHVHQNGEEMTYGSHASGGF